MKGLRHILIYFLATYLVVLFGMPCNDGCANESHTASQTVIQAQDHHEEEHNVCAPFCTCSCCNIPVIVQQSTLFAVQVFAEPQQFAVSYKSLISEYNGSIWQPPKLG